MTKKTGKRINKASTPEKCIKQCLSELGIQFICEKTFKQLKSKNRGSLRFDFYLPKYRMAIEFDGKHHFEPIYGYERYLDTIDSDLRKDLFCKKYQIRLRRFDKITDAIVFLTELVNPQQK